MEKYNNEITVEGKVCLVTGATSGIGAATACELARMGGTVVLVGRNSKKCIRAVKNIIRSTGNTSVDYIQADLASIRHIYRLADRFKRHYSHLDILINNVGGYYLSRYETTEGNELSFALNYLSGFLLTNLLQDRLSASKAARIVNLTSNAFEDGQVNFDDIQSRVSYQGFRAYAQAKLALMYFTHDFARQHADDNISINALYPGCSLATNFGKSNGLIRYYTKRLLQKKYPAMVGAECVMHLVTRAEIANVTGKYFIKDRQSDVFEQHYDSGVAARLWSLSEDLTRRIIRHESLPVKLPAGAKVMVNT